MTARKIYVYSGIWLVILISIGIIAHSFWHISQPDAIVTHSSTINHFIQRLLAVLLFAVAWGLYKKRRLAWIISIAALAISLFLYFVLHRHYFNAVISACEIYTLIVLLTSSSWFVRKADPLSLRRGAAISVCIICAVLLSGAAGYYMLHVRSGANVSLGKCLADTVANLFDPADGLAGGTAYEWFVFFFIWVSFALCVLLVLHPAVTGKATEMAALERARRLVKAYGQNPSSYLTLEDDKLLYFGKEVEGVVAYGAIGDIMIVNGDPICAPEDFARLLAEFKAFCAEQAYSCVFLGTTAQFLEIYGQLGFHHIKCGEEARFELADYQLAGGKMAKLRALINHADKAGLTVKEYRPNDEFDENIEKNINLVSEAWLEGKKSGMLGFSVGGIGLENPMDKRYFYAVDPDGRMVAFNVFVPFAAMQGYMADVTRRIPGAPAGATEKLVYEGFVTFRDEGLKWGSMGLAPLANVLEDDTKDSAGAKLLNFIYEKCNGFYGFKDLRHAKEKYSPTAWEPGYFVYNVMTPQMAYAIVAIQNPGGVADFLKGFLRGKRRGKVK